MSVDRAFLPPLYTTYVIYGCQEPQTKFHNSIAALTGVILERESAIANRNAINRQESPENRLGEGGFIDIVDVNERLLVKPAPTNIVVNLWNQRGRVYKYCRGE